MQHVCGHADAYSVKWGNNSTSLIELCNYEFIIK